MPVLNYRDPVDGTFKPLSAGQAIIPAGDFNACTATGLYSIAGNATNGLPNGGGTAGASVGILQVFAIDSTHVQQVFYGGANQTAGEVWIRSNTAGTWSAWDSVVGRIPALGNFGFTATNGIYALAGTATGGPGVAGVGILVCYGHPLGIGGIQANTIQTWTSYVTGEMWQRQNSGGAGFTAWSRILGIPTGGSQGAVLRKASATAYDVAWSQQSGAVVSEKVGFLFNATWGVTAQTAYATFGGQTWPQNFVKQFAGTLLVAELGVSGWVTGAAGMVYCGFSWAHPTVPAANQTCAQFFFNTVGVHSHWWGLQSWSGVAAGTLPCSFWIKVGTGTTTVTSDANDSLCWKIYEIWP
jgi:hypothetical protein